MSPCIDTVRLHERIERLAAIGRKDDGSCCRLALTDEDAEGRRLVKSWMEEAGLAVRIDRIGNMIGVQPGDATPVMTGSHIDTVATGGRFDGNYGVLAGIEAAHAVASSGVRLARPFAVGVFTNEEGVRFEPDMMGSMVYAGLLPLEDALAARDQSGVRLGDELARTGFAGEAPCGFPRPHAYVELHIEQGPVLERENLVLGAVTDLQAISWQEISFSGVSNHAGTTPMSLRKDAGYSAARLTVYVRELAQSIAGQVGTVGSIRLQPGLTNVIPRKAVMTVDLRNTDDKRLKLAETNLGTFLMRIAAEEGVTYESRRLVRTLPVVFDPKIVAVIEDVARSLGHPAKPMTSGAGHDAQMLASICPAAMIFVPSVGGVSHNPGEFTAPAHLEIGAEALLQTMMRLAET
ncbi:MAG: M20 family metallo-hydrolase [Hyphomonadaceae bacterium]|nr:M20 family metallo-hydrolase [Hyphomonadaceae bacterium]